MSDREGIPYRRIMVVADTHGDFGSLNKAYLQCRPDFIIHLGDGVEDILRLARIHSVAFEAVNGNNDPAEAYPLETVLEIAGRRILLFHGHMTDLRQLSRLDRQFDARMVLHGHTHQPEDREERGIRILNPGALCFYLSGGRPGYIVLHPEDKAIHAERVLL